MTRTSVLFLLLLVALAARPAQADLVTFDWALVGNPGNAAAFGVYGGVDYDYRIGRYEVTNAQYATFLNAVAGTDSFGGVDPALYNPSMGSDARGGITRSGTPGGYTYATKPNMDSKPVNYVSFIDAMRFTNWLHNGQGSSGTEIGAYTIGNGLNEVRSADARFWVPGQDEWFKAAYHDASAGTAGAYYQYATRSNTEPTVATVNGVGDISNPGVNVVNYAGGNGWSNVTTVGSAGLDSASPYGTFDQNGNVDEWNEDISSFNSAARITRGGQFNGNFLSLQLGAFSSWAPTTETSIIGFRVATVPEPSAAMMTAVAAIVAMAAKAASGLTTRQRD